MATDGSRKSLSRQWDVVVAGAGFAGCAAAVAAARCGARTLLLERGSGPGGVAVAGGCPSIMALAHESRPVVGGVGEAFMRRLLADGEACPVDPVSGCPVEPTAPDAPFRGAYISSGPALRRGWNRMLLDVGVTPLYGTTVVGCRVGGRTVRGVEAFTGDRIDEFEAGVVIDATGCGAVAALAGAECLYPAPEEAMTKTVLFRLGGVRDFDKSRVRETFARLYAAGQVPVPVQDRFMGGATLNPGEVLVNLTLAAGDGLDPVERTRMDIELREQVTIWTAFLRRHFAGFEECYVAGEADTLGMRVTRNVVGREVIRCIDLDEDRPVAEPVALGFRRYGDHGVHSFYKHDASPKYGVRGVPMGALAARDFDNLLTAGMIISVEPRAVTAVRLLGTCLATGHAAGAMAARGAGKADYGVVRATLLEQGALLG